MMQIQNQVQFLTINNDDAGQRIDNFLLKHLKGIPSRMIYRIIRKGEVRINSSRIKPEYKIQTSDLIRIPPIRFVEKQQNATSIKLDKIATTLSNYTLYEDEHLLVLNKPSGILVHAGGGGVDFGIIEILRILRPEALFWELVHRLDRETSGVLLIAKKRSVLRLLHQQLRLRQMQKRYIALVKGQWPSHVKIIQAPLLKKIQNNEQMVKVSANGKYSETHFKIEEYFSNATLVNISPITGRTHQIRVHAQYIKHPIAFDNRYGDRNFDQQLMTTGLKRLFLHASSLIFIHPVIGETLTFNAPLDRQLKSCLVSLRE